MKESIKRGIKVTLIGVAVIALVVIGFIFNVFFGNPISKYNATEQMSRYLQDTYGMHNFIISDTKYNFKDTVYHIYVTSPTSEDTQFDVSYGDNKIQDNYEEYVENKFNTHTRLNAEFDKIVMGFFEEKYTANIFIAGIGKYEENAKSLTLDMPLDMESLPMDSFATIYMESDDMSWEALAKLAKEINEHFVSRQIFIHSYDLVFEDNLDSKNTDVVGVYDFDTELLQEENLAEFMENHYKTWVEKHNKDKIQEEK